MKIDCIKKIGIAGSGIMGSGIAQLFARKGYTVIVTDIKEEFLENSKKLITTFNSSLIEDGKDVEAIKQRDKMLLKMLKHFNGA